MLLIPLVFLLFINAVGFLPGEIHLEVKRSLSHSKVFESEDIEVVLKLKNTGKKISFLEIYDTLPDKVGIERGSNYSALYLKENEEIEIRYTVNCPIRGRYRIGPLKTRVRDFFGLFYKEKVFDNPFEVTVIPRIEEIGEIMVKPRKGLLPGVIRSHKRGIGTEFFGIREYMPGDVFKRINWKASARWNRLRVNEYELECTTDVVIILDARDTESIGSLVDNPLKYGVTAAVSLASYLLKRRDRVGLIIYGESTYHMKWVYPETGEKQLYKIIDELIQIKSTGDSCFAAAIDTAITHLLPKKSMLILISSLEGDFSITSTVEDLVARGFDVLIISPSAIDIERMLHPEEENYEIAHRVLTLGRKNLIFQLQQCGARVINWDPKIPLAVSLKEAERSRH